MVSAAIRGIFTAGSGQRGARAARRGRRAPRARSRRRSPSCCWTPRPTCSASTRFPREHWSKLRSHQPARARQPRDRPPHRRRRHLPQRRRADPARRRAADRTERRVARRPPLPLPRITLVSPGPRRSHTHQGEQQDQGGARPQRRLRDQRLTDDPGLHHEPLLDSNNLGQHNTDVAAAQSTLTLRPWADDAVTDPAISVLQCAMSSSAANARTSSWQRVEGWPAMLCDSAAWLSAAQRSTEADGVDERVDE